LTLTHHLQEEKAFYEKAKNLVSNFFIDIADLVRLAPDTPTVRQNIIHSVFNSSANLTLNSLTPAFQALQLVLPAAPASLMESQQRILPISRVPSKQNPISKPQILL